MKSLPVLQTDAVSYRSPTLHDARHLYLLAQRATTLDVNSEYCYLLSCLHHATTCVMTEIDGKPAGFLTAYRLPQEPEGLFIWQIGVDPEFHRRGLAKNMLESVLNRSALRDITFLEMTIAPSNIASLHLFQSLARSIDTEMIAVGTLESHLFSTPHDAEIRYRIAVASHPFHVTN